MVHTRKPVFKTTALNILSLDEEVENTNTETSKNNNAAAAVRVPTSSGSAAPKSSDEKMPTSFQGFDMKTDPKIRRQAKKSWFDLDDNSSTATTPFVSASPFEGISGNVPAFPPPSAEEPVAAAPEQHHTVVDEEEPNESPSTPPRDEVTAPVVSSPPLKPGEEDADGAEGFEASPENQRQLPPQQFNSLPSYGQAPPQHYFAPRYNPYQPQQAFLPQQHGAFRSHQHQEASTRVQPPQHQAVAPQLPRARSNRSSGSSSPAPQEGAPSSELPSTLSSRPANYELLGFLPFYKFDEMALTGDLPTADMLGTDPKQHPKLFLGHVWSRVPTGVIQWMLKSFSPSDATAFSPQLHYNREGWFRGCLHCSVVTDDVQALIYALHKRVLFDHEGVWFAQTADQMKILDDYCRRLRALPQHIRHNKLQSLPCNPLACELARNE